MGPCRLRKGSLQTSLYFRAHNWSTKIEHSSLYFLYTVFLVYVCVFCVYFTSLIQGTFDKGSLLVDSHGTIDRWKMCFSEELDTADTSRQLEIHRQLFKPIVSEPRFNEVKLSLRNENVTNIKVLMRFLILGCRGNSGESSHSLHLEQGKVTTVMKTT